MFIAVAAASLNTCKVSVYAEISLVLCSVALHTQRSELECRARLQTMQNWLWGGFIPNLNCNYVVRSARTGASVTWQ
jgi:hypothetical protein